MANWKSKRKDAAGSLTDEFDRLQDEFDSLRGRLARIAGETVREFNDSPQKLAELKSVIDERLTLLESDLGALSRELRVRGGAAVGKAEKAVHERPLAALAIAAGVGFVAAHLWRRRRSS